MQKNNYVKVIVTTAILVFSFGQGVSFLAFIFDDLIKGVLWGIAVECLIFSAILFIVNNNTSRHQTYKYFYLILGIILFFICSFVYLNWYIAIRLIFTVIFLMLALIFSCRLLLSMKNSENK